MHSVLANISLASYHFPIMFLFSRSAQNGSKMQINSNPKTIFPGWSPLLSFTINLHSQHWTTIHKNEWPAKGFIYYCDRHYQSHRKYHSKYEIMAMDYWRRIGKISDYNAIMAVLSFTKYIWLRTLILIFYIFASIKLYKTHILRQH